MIAASAIAGAMESSGTGRYERFASEWLARRIAMKAVSFGQWLRYQTGGGHTAKSHAANASGIRMTKERSLNTRNRRTRRRVSVRLT